MTTTTIASPRVLDLGCGNKLRPGPVRIDFDSRTASTIIHDLNVFPYPLEDASFDEIYLDNTLEHLDEPLHVMEEVYRICRPGGLPVAQARECPELPREAGPASWC